MNLIEREQRASRRRCRQPVNQDLDEVVHQQRQELRILTAEMQKTKAALEEKGFLLEKERRQNAVLSRQLSLLRKLRDAERKGFQGSLKRAGCQLERELEKYVAAAYQQNLSFFGETTARDSAIGVNPDEEGQYGQATVQQDYESQACQFLGPPQESTVEGYERAEAMPGNAAEIEVTESVQFEEGADAEGVGDVEEGA
ncbi:hypothetical protein CSUI_011255 [Cystoisospora suis]|uniref:Uncharacterized protein n=1 Tax=Cystoisospora suis TaxID=483139 RepID=A0A2C6KET8_9APIC|nr:hypothetical protein CSUI_011255 [Cystoisospora suis]